MLDTLEALAYSGEPVLDVIRAARTTVSDNNETFEFCDWQTCTCGHIYHAVRGEGVPDTKFEQAPGLVTGYVNQTYVQVLEAILIANRDKLRLSTAQMYLATVEARRKNNASDESVVEALTNGVSRATQEIAERTACSSRTAARRLLSNTIEALEEQYEQDRLDVLAQMKKAVSNLQELPVEHEVLVA